MKSVLFHLHLVQFPHKRCPVKSTLSFSDLTKIPVFFKNHNIETYLTHVRM